MCDSHFSIGPLCSVDIYACIAFGITVLHAKIDNKMETKGIEQKEIQNEINEEGKSSYVVNV